MGSRAYKWLIQPIYRLNRNADSWCGRRQLMGKWKFRPESFEFISFQILGFIDLMRNAMGWIVSWILTSTKSNSHNEWFELNISNENMDAIRHCKYDNLISNRNPFTGWMKRLRVHFCACRRLPPTGKYCELHLMKMVSSSFECGLCHHSCNNLSLILNHIYIYMKMRRHKWEENKMKSKSEKEKNDADGAIERDGKKYYHLGRRFKNRGKKEKRLVVWCPSRGTRKRTFHLEDAIRCRSRRDKVKKKKTFKRIHHFLRSSLPSHMSCLRILSSNFAEVRHFWFGLVVCSSLIIY